MGIRETINKNPQMALGIGGGVLVLGLILLVWQLMPAKAEPPRPGRAYFTDDDGQNFFDAEIWSSIPPFKHNGKEAVRAHVFRCGETGRPFVVWMEKYRPDAKAKIDRFYQDAANRGQFPPEFTMDSGREYKRASSKQWRPWSNEVFSVNNAKCPDGTMPGEITPPKP